MRELHDDEDMAEMYVLYKRKSNVLLWLYGSVNIEESSDRDDTTLPRKRARTDSPLPTSMIRDSIAKTLSTVEDVKLKERHGESSLSVEHCNRWAHMINSGKCSSYEEPPDFPFFKKAKGGKRVQEGKEGS